MSDLSNNARLAGFTHAFKIDFGNYATTTGNDDISVTLFPTPDADAGLWVLDVAVVLVDEFSADGAVSVTIGDATDADGFAKATTQATAGSRGQLLGYSDGAYFNDGTTDSILKRNFTDEAVTATLTLASGNWSSAAAGKVLVLVSAFTGEDFL